MPSKKCIHEKTKQSCKICAPHNFCPCGRLTRQCKNCNGSNVCFDHIPLSPCGGAPPPREGKVRRLKSDCLECHPEKACEHGKLKRKCHKCNSKLRCECGKLKYNCYLHSPGNRFCEHKRFRSQCRTCIIAASQEEAAAGRAVEPVVEPDPCGEVATAPGGDAIKVTPELLEFIARIQQTTGHKTCIHARRLYYCHVCNEKAAKRREDKRTTRLANRASRQAAEEKHRDILDAARADLMNGFAKEVVLEKYNAILRARRDNKF